MFIPKLESALRCEATPNVHYELWRGDINDEGETWIFIPVNLFQG